MKPCYRLDCKGSLFLDHDGYNWFYTCLICARQYTLTGKRIRKRRHDGSASSPQDKEKVTVIVL